MGFLVSWRQRLLQIVRIRLAPEGPLRDYYGRAPLFGVYLALKRPGRVRVGDLVYVRYKPAPF